MKEQLALMLGIGAIIILLVLASCKLIACKAELNRYKKYYNCAESLLNRLESDFNWIDRSDNSAVDEYYDARNEIEKLQEQLRK